MKYTLFSFLLFFTCAFISCAQDKHTDKQATVKEEVPKDLSKYKTATFAAGCFWHEEALFKSIKGVAAAVSGYAGGTTKDPTYDEVETGNTGHAESVLVYYDSSKISYPALLKVYFESMEDPTQVNGQGPDEGTQYRSIVFYNNPVEEQYADQLIAQMNRSRKYSKVIAAQVVPFTKFWEAERYHQNYVQLHPDEPYVHNVSIRDVRRYQEAHPEMIKPGAKL